MVAQTALQASTVLQTADGVFGISWELLLLAGIAIVVVIALIWMFTQQGGSTD